MNSYRGAGNRLAAFLSFVFIALALVALALGPRGGPNIAIAIVLVVVALAIPQSLMMANQWERAVVLRMGRLQGI